MLLFDADQDGDLDLLLGNAGTNMQFKASPTEPVHLFVSDLNQDGVLDLDVADAGGGVVRLDLQRLAVPEVALAGLVGDRHRDHVACDVQVPIPHALAGMIAFSKGTQRKENEGKPALAVARKLSRSSSRGGGTLLFADVAVQRALLDMVVGDEGRAVLDSFATAVPPPSLERSAQIQAYRSLWFRLHIFLAFVGIAATALTAFALTLPIGARTAPGAGCAPRALPRFRTFPRRGETPRRRTSLTSAWTDGHHPRARDDTTGSGTFNRAMRGLFDHYMDHPEELPEWDLGASPCQRVADYIAGMTDRYCIAKFTELTVPEESRF